MNTKTKPSGINCQEGCPNCAELKPHPKATNDLERVTQMATELGLLPEGDLPKEPVERFIDYQDLQEQLLAFEQAVLAKRDEDYQTLQEEVDALNGALILSANKVKKLEGEIGVHKFCEVQAVQLSKAHREEIESLQEKLAMQAESMEWAAQWVEDDKEEIATALRKTLNATTADVDHWMQGEKAEAISEFLKEQMTRDYSKWPNKELALILPEFFHRLHGEFWAKERGGVR